MLETRFIFPTPVWKGNFKDYAPENFFEKNIQYCLDSAKSSKGRFLTNVGGWQSEALSEKLINASPFNPFFTHLQKVTRQIESNLNTSLKFTYNNAWINVNYKSCYNDIHVHPRASLSGVFYITENNSPITFYNGDRLYEWGMRNLAADPSSPLVSPSYSLQPSQGDFLLFYPWLMHSVESNHTDEARISIAFNLSMQ